MQKTVGAIDRLEGSCPAAGDLLDARSLQPHDPARGRDPDIAVAVTLPIVGGVGLDALLGLFPVAGDAASAAVSISLIAKSVRYGIPPEVIRKMLANVLVDLLLGAVPLVGDLADMWFKANERNVTLLKEYLGDEARSTIDVAAVRR